MKSPLIIGITGGSASGKTFFLHSLLSHFTDDEICLISQDNYYKEIEFVPRDRNGVENFDVPESIDFELFAKHINDLRAGKEVHKMEYTFNNSTIKPKDLVFKPAPIIVVEGIFVFHDPYISQMLNLKVFIDAKEHIKIRRRIIRDNNERGYDLQDVLYRWENHVAPTYEKFIEPTKHDADLIINNNHHFENGLKILTTYLNLTLGK
ncbi:MAG: uridine kinase [Cytophagaceae bacterium]|nr:uridine kinase [Cytophagaceae bacterium]MBK9509245.1 uridine kinase [Cytophagaceae bacterium]MBK9933758.1 uridine kinase [Cytophagaceae bacterium]MBL0302527.1 uridine kinase [Cytophagaceae bacterium]MBL0325355.1 uridine kinase [Cytophagaceae bacterium]